jgi:hypothetical protein
MTDKKNKTAVSLRPEYDFDYTKAIRGKYYRRLINEGSTKVVRLSQIRNAEVSEHWFTVTFPRPNVESESENGPKTPPEDQVTPEVTPEVQSMLAVLDGEMSRRDIMRVLGLSDEKHFRENYQQAAVRLGLIEMTIPDKPRSRNQKYRLTARGAALLNSRKDG